MLPKYLRGGPDAHKGKQDVLGITPGVVGPCISMGPQNIQGQCGEDIN